VLHFMMPVWWLLGYFDRQGMQGQGGDNQPELSGTLYDVIQDKECVYVIGRCRGNNVCRQLAMNDSLIA
jgi:hypothetical protein